ncbi:MAG: hypothetical protein KH142_04595, partial [Slackia piriformis]|nr:hypothetical protein [Slackia piriformis]
MVSENVSPPTLTVWRSRSIESFARSSSTATVALHCVSVPRAHVTLDARASMPTVPLSSSV